MPRAFGRALAALATIVALPRCLPAQDSLEQAHRDTLRVYEVPAITVTATRSPKEVFRTAGPVTVVDSTMLREKSPNSAADLFRELPGLDVTGVGANQGRPGIRGLRGQRILLLEDGIRLNNSRRQQDFGEIPALVDVTGIARVEVVRGPASVLYGTDAIGGVVNLITQRPPAGADQTVRGTMGYIYSTADNQQRPYGSLTGRSGRLDYRLGGSFRSTDAYEAPSGTFGKIFLPVDTRVQDTGGRDWSGNLEVGVGLGNGRAFGKFEHYHAIDAGFGQVLPADYAPTVGFTQILYPSQDFDKYTLGYQVNGLRGALADRVNFISYYQSNDRYLDINVNQSFANPPGASVTANSHNYTSLHTFGFRAEAVKALGGSQVLTYGADLFRDHSTNYDNSLTTLIGFGPPQTIPDNLPKVPNANFRSAGLFVQDEVGLTSRFTMGLGARVQDTHAATEATIGLTAPLSTSHDRSVVGTANLAYLLTEQLNVVASVGRGFRSPNLIDRFFSGQVPEVGGVQIPNPGLKPETSVNVDLGLKYRQGSLYAEGFIFRNDIHNGMRADPTGDSLGGQPVYQNINVDKLRYWGVELMADIGLGHGFSTGANYTHLKSKDVLQPNNPIGDSYSDKINLEAAYHHPTGRFWLAYDFRWNGEQKDASLAQNPVGNALPAFTVHTVGGGVRLFTWGRQAHSIGLAVHNLTNRLYAESSNTSFFRPEPKRNVVVTYSVGF